MLEEINLFNSLKQRSFFINFNNLRRRFLESRLFDLLILSQAQKLERFPGALVIDNTNLCNAKCSWCPNIDIPGEKGIMNHALFKKIIEDYARIGGIVRFGTFGEPLLDPDFTGKIDFIRRFSSIYKVELVTNGFALNEDIAEKLIASKVDTEISLDELDKALYEKVKGVSFDKTWNNLRGLLKKNQNAKSPVQINVRIKTSTNERQIRNHSLFQELTQPNCTVDITPINSVDSLTNWGGAFDKNSFLSGSDKSSPYGAYKDYNRTNQAPCIQLWKWMVINWDGRVVLCCTDIFSRMVLGDLKKQNIKDVWNGPVLDQLRQQFMNRKGRFDGICRDCDLHQGWQYLKLYYERSNGRIRRGRRFIS